MLLVVLMLNWIIGIHLVNQSAIKVRQKLAAVFIAIIFSLALAFLLL